MDLKIWVLYCLGVKFWSDSFGFFELNQKRCLSYPTRAELAIWKRWYGMARGRYPDWITRLDCRIVLDRIRFWQSEIGSGLEWIKFPRDCGSDWIKFRPIFFNHCCMDTFERLLACRISLNWMIGFNLWKSLYCWKCDCIIKLIRQFTTVIWVYYCHRLETVN